MNLVTVIEFWESRGFESLIKPRSIVELEFHFMPKNGYDNKPPFIFIQKDLFTTIWNIGHFTDHQHTWETGLGHFTYTIKALIKEIIK